MRTRYVIVTVVVLAFVGRVRERQRQEGTSPTTAAAAVKAGTSRVAPA